MRRLAMTSILLLASFVAAADDAAETPEVVENEATEEQDTAEQGDGIKSPKTMSGMSILGNEEAPKSLVIIPWKSSELGDDISLNDTLDDRARPVDKEVFLRELRFYEIRSDE
ncbi:MAG: hypothetical protein ACR2QT_10100 [Woeseiaceae bacterium]